MKSVYLVMTDASTMMAFGSLDRAVKRALVDWQADSESETDSETVKIMVRDKDRFLFSSGVRIERLMVY